MWLRVIHTTFNLSQASTIHFAEGSSDCINIEFSDGTYSVVFSSARSATVCHSKNFTRLLSGDNFLDISSNHFVKDVTWKPTPVEVTIDDIVPVKVSIENDGPMEVILDAMTSIDVNIDSISPLVLPIEVYSND